MTMRWPWQQSKKLKAEIEEDREEIKKIRAEHVRLRRRVAALEELHALEIEAEVMGGYSA